MDRFSLLLSVLPCCYLCYTHSWARGQITTIKNLCYLVWLSISLHLMVNLKFRQWHLFDKGNVISKNSSCWRVNGRKTHPETFRRCYHLDTQFFHKNPIWKSQCHLSPVWQRQCHILDIEDQRQIPILVALHSLWVCLYKESLILTCRDFQPKVKRR